MLCVCIAELLEMLLSEENVMDVVGALEYDPELAVRQNHRAFLREHVIFKEVRLPQLKQLTPGCLAKHKHAGCIAVYSSANVSCACRFCRNMSIKGIIDL